MLARRPRHKQAQKLSDRLCVGFCLALGKRTRWIEGRPGSLSELQRYTTLRDRELVAGLFQARRRKWIEDHPGGGYLLTPAGRAAARPSANQ